MEKITYLKEVNVQLERFLVYETVFTEYAATCHKIEVGNCLASENFSRLQDSYSRNILRFNHFVSECQEAPTAPGFHEFHHTFMNVLAQVQHAASIMLMAIDTDGVNHRLMERGTNMQTQARATLNAACANLEQAM